VRERERESRGSNRFFSKLNENGIFLPSIIITTGSELVFQCQPFIFLRVVS
jgi:hypothetical protein